MTTHISSTEAKASFSSLVSKVQYGGERVIIERRGKPVAAVVSLEDLASLQRDSSPDPRPLGALGIIGAWAELGDEAIDEFIEHVYRERAADQGRPVDLDL